MPQAQAATKLYRRVLLKLSGEALMGDQGYGIDPKVIDRVAADISDIQKLGIQICIVIGGGNIFRGVSTASEGLQRVTADHMGMLATVINALAIQNSLENLGVSTRVQSAIPMESICETYVRRLAEKHLRKNRVVVFAAGSGNPYFTTDTAAALRASELDCDVLLKGTKVDGVYSADPVTCPDAERYEQLTYKKVISDDLKVMDTAAIALTRENNIPIVVFSIKEPGSLKNVIVGKGDFTIVS